jgi:hypothetical protein
MPSRRLRSLTLWATGFILMVDSIHQNSFNCGCRHHGEEPSRGNFCTDAELAIKRRVTPYNQWNEAGLPKISHRDSAAPCHGESTKRDVRCLKHELKKVKGFVHETCSQSTLPGELELLKDEVMKLRATMCDMRGTLCEVKSIAETAEGFANAAVIMAEVSKSGVDEFDGKSMKRSGRCLKHEVKKLRSFVNEAASHSTVSSEFEALKEEMRRMKEAVTGTVNEVKCVTETAEDFANAAVIMAEVSNSGVDEFGAESIKHDVRCLKRGVKKLRALVHETYLQSTLPGKLELLKDEVMKLWATLYDMGGTLCEVKCIAETAEDFANAAVIMAEVSKLVVDDFDGQSTKRDIRCLKHEMRKQRRMVFDNQSRLVDLNDALLEVRAITLAAEEFANTAETLAEVSQSALECCGNNPPGPHGLLRDI